MSPGRIPLSMYMMPAKLDILYDNCCSNTKNNNTIKSLIFDTKTLMFRILQDGVVDYENVNLRGIKNKKLFKLLFTYLSRYSDTKRNMFIERSIIMLYIATWTYVNSYIKKRLILYWNTWFNAIFDDKYIDTYLHIINEGIHAVNKNINTETTIIIYKDDYNLYELIETFKNKAEQILNTKVIKISQLEECNEKLILGSIFRDN